MKHLLPLILPLLSIALPVVAQQQEACPVIKLEAERLPDLNIPRAGHALFYARSAEGRLQGKNGELTVAGGHTNGFVPTPTAEYLKDGKWHTMPMTYTHDFGLSVVLKSGKVLLAGGCEQPTGIGQTYTAELYDPQTHTFRGFGNMYQKRVWASALELDSGQVVIAGNWYQKDGIELFHEVQSSSGDYKGKSSQFPDRKLTDIYIESGFANETSFFRTLKCGYLTMDLDSGTPLNLMNTLYRCSCFHPWQ